MSRDNVRVALWRATTRVLSALLTVFGASVIAFIFIRLAPGNPARLTLGPLAPAAAVQAQIRHLGLDQPLYLQYAKYITQFFRGDWGFVYGAGQSVTQQLGARLPASIELGLYAFGFAATMAVSLAVAVVYRRSRILDGIVRAIAFVAYGTPPFWFGLMGLYFFFSLTHLLPGPEGRLGAGIAPPPAVTHLYTVDALLAGQLHTFVSALWHLLLPALTLSLVPFAYLVRLLRVNLLDMSREPFLLVVRGKGVNRWRTLTRHALPNALLPVEKIFNWPGVGALVVDSILNQDFAFVQTFILLSACLYVVVNLLVEVLYGVIDPRSRVDRSGLRR